jgi:hypothetical protein
MPINIIAQGFTEGISSIPYGWTAIKVVPCLAILYLLKWYFQGATNGSERNMHGKVVMITVNTDPYCLRPNLIADVGRYLRYRSRSC